MLLAPRCGAGKIAGVAVRPRRAASTMRRIFLSYGHDEHRTLAERLKEDLQARGHEVWFDADRLMPGADWERYIEEGLEWAAAIPIEGASSSS